jgi:NhaP-type Na+/H+ or K+/H+ antiporter
MLPLVIGYRDDGLSHWFVHVLLYQVVGATLAGAALGLIAGRAVSWAEDRHLLDDSHFLVFSVALSLFALGLGRLGGLDGLLMVFVTGLGLARGCRTERLRRQREVQDAVNELMIVGIFVLLGMLAPWHEWARLGWSGLALVLGVLFLRRLPWLVLLTRDVPDLHDMREGALAGWLGPIGVGAVFYAALAEREAAVPDLWNASTLVVAASVAAYAATSAALVTRYGRSVRARDAQVT